MKPVVSADGKTVVWYVLYWECSETRRCFFAIALQLCVRMCE